MAGRPSKYSEDIAKKICEALAHGKSLVSICKESGMPNYSTVMDWLCRDHPSFKQGFPERYARARDVQADYLAEEIIQIADDGSNDVSTREDREGNTYDVVNNEVINRSRLRVDARKWIASKLKPKKYGDKLELAGDQTSPINLKIDVRKLSESELDSFLDAGTKAAPGGASTTRA